MGIWQRILWQLRKALGIRSPSEEFAKANAQVLEWMQQGMEQGQDGVSHAREMTQAKLRGLAMCCEIVARAFTGYFDDIDEEDTNHGET